eukprot:TRINITY_DN4152_c0_g1_i1.p1 TRINITY_DN4152_c0_g1~~TRINITY_DN4152_c0_g1_i1.p1  ORF type:complete len:430 (+),score=120.16 TRINITY_DN4152_c0_g1_i1:41-1330(+)
MRSILALLLLVSIGSQLFSLSSAAEVFELTDGNFDQITAEGKWIVEFFAPWCGHCQHLAPIYEEAARRINNEHQGKFRLASVDCTVNTELAARFGIRGYPTLKYFRGGMVTDYNGERTAESFVEFAKRVTGNPVTRIGASGVGSLRRQNPVSFLLFSTSSRILEVFTRVAGKYQDLLRFAVTDDRAVLKELRVANQELSDAILLLNDDDEVSVYTGVWDEASIETFVKNHQLPIISEITGTSWENIKMPGLPIVVITVDPKKHLDLVRTSFRPSAKAFAGSYVFGWIDGTNQRYRYFLNDHNMVAERIPDFVVIDEKGNKFWEDINVDKSNPESIKAFLTAVADGKVDAQGPGSSTFGHITAVLRGMFREIGNSYALMAVGGILLLVLGLTFWMVCSGGDGDEELEQMMEEDEKAAEEKEKAAKAKKAN